ncbi:MAG: hypothetical protein JRG67_09035, partial [Deltaproteobacteria bacterium]|nr:hypothetical protein [Deltaproteobacteria bacterium]MBW2550744.1 hypothetical protein [Deltaproteobacteria bacterium]
MRDVGDWRVRVAEVDLDHRRANVHAIHDLDAPHLADQRREIHDAADGAGHDMGAEVGHLMVGLRDLNQHLMGGRARQQVGPDVLRVSRGLGAIPQPL